MDATCFSCCRGPLKYDVETSQPFHTISMSQAIQLGDLESGTLFAIPPCSYRSNPM